MRIIHIAETIKGGIGSCLNDLIVEQNEAFSPSNVKFIIPENESVYLSYAKEGQILGFISPKRSLKSFYVFIKHTLAVLKQEKPDIIHLHSTFSGALIRPFLFLPFIHKPKVVYCAHGWAFTMEISSWKKKIYVLIEKVLSFVTDKIICISNTEYDAAIDYGMSAKRCLAFCNAVAPLLATFTAKNVMDDKQKNYLFVGRFDRQKGLDILIDAVKSISKPNFNLYIAGAAVLAENVELDLPDNVIILGWMDRDELTSYYMKADALIMPSRWEGFGLTAAEAMRAGTPVIASNRGALPELIPNNECGLIFDLNNQQELSNTLQNTTKEQLASYGKAVKKRFENNYTVDRLNNEIINLYKSLMDV